MLLKQILLKATKGKTKCSSDGCPIYHINTCNVNLNKMYRYFIGEDISFDNQFSNCSELFLSLCYEYNKKRAKEMFDKYVDDGNNFYVGSTNQMPCFLLKKMTKFMLQKIKLIDIE